MEKRDMIVIIVAIFIVLIMAMYIKPLVTGKEAKLIPDEISGLFGPKNDSVEGLNYSQIENASKALEINQSLINDSLINDSLIINRSPIPTTTPLIQPWNGTPVTLPPGTPIRQGIIPREYVTSDQRYSFKEPAASFKTYTTISGEYSQKSSPIFIPSKYWEIWYSVELPEDLQNPILEEQSDDEDNVQSLSAINPFFQITIKNLDTNEIIATLTPSGGLDPKVWKGIFGRGEDSTTTVLSEKGDEIEINWDPRPWKEKFFEGYHTYEFEIIARYLTSYSLDIKLPDPSAYNNSNTSNIESKVTPSLYFEEIINHFIALYDEDFLKDSNKTEMMQLLSSELINEKGTESILSDLYLMKLSGKNISQFQIDNSFYRLNEGNIKGTFIWNFNNKDYQTLYEIPFINENGFWKMNTLPILRV